MVIRAGNLDVSERNRPAIPLASRDADHQPTDGSGYVAYRAPTSIASGFHAVILSRQRPSRLDIMATGQASSSTKRQRTHDLPECPEQIICARGIIYTYSADRDS
jgi:hypothetical protein